MTKIIGFSGQKQSGKDLSCSFIIAKVLVETGVCERSRINPETGELEISDVLGHTVGGLEWIPFQDDFVNVDAVLTDVGVVKKYALADRLKDICINVMGLDKKLVYGDDRQKNKLTKYKWENMPGVIVYAEDYEYDEIFGVLDSYGLANKFTFHQGTGFMTVREVLQYVGTEVFRMMNPDIWVDSVMSKIEKDNPKLALISDVRFENEIGLIKDVRGSVILGLERGKKKKVDSHTSEQAPLDKCDAIIKNKGSMDDLFKAIDQNLERLNFSYK